MVEIRLFSECDWAAVWQILEPVFRAVETYPYSPSISSADARTVWVTTMLATFVAADENGKTLGTYYLKPNQPELGAETQPRATMAPRRIGGFVCRWQFAWVAG